MPMPMTKDTRTFVDGKFALQLDGLVTGFVRSISGGDITADVVQEKTGADNITRKHIGTPKYAEIETEVGLADCKALHAWVKSSMSRAYDRKHGSLLFCDFNYKVRHSRDFYEALISEIKFPALDGASKEPAYLTVKWTPEYTRDRKGDQHKLNVPVNKYQKQFLPCNFRFRMPGLDGTKVAKIESFSIKQKNQTDDLGDARDYLVEPASLEFPDVKITLAKSHADSWYKWHEDFVIRGNCGDEDEKDGEILYLAPNGEERLARINLSHCGIFKIEDVKATAGSQEIKRVTAHLYCEEMEYLHR